jgi:hypothetical protein
MSTSTESPTFLPVGERVRSDTFGWMTVMAHMVAARPSGNPEFAHPFYVCELDEGFWNEGRSAYVTIVVIHADGIHAIVRGDD